MKLDANRPKRPLRGWKEVPIYFFVLNSNILLKLVEKSYKDFIKLKVNILLKIQRSDMADGLIQRLAREMIRQRSGTRSGISEIKNHQYFLMFGQAERLMQFVRIKAVDPA